MGTMEEQIRKIVREEIARALGAMSDVAETATPGYAKESDRFALQAIRSVTQRVARDVLANVHPAAEAEHTASTPDRDPGDACTCGHDFYRHREGACFACTCPRFHPVPVGTEPVHTITAVPERASTVCSCSGHVHVMGYNDLCCYPGCRCGTPVRARAEHTGARVHVSENIAGTSVPRACTVCLHGEHDQGKCGMHVYVDGTARPCPCLASRTVRSTRGPGCGHITCEGWPACRDPKPVSTLVCTLCEHAPHGAGNCRYAVASGACLCTGGRPASTATCTLCEHNRHAGQYCPECRCKGGLR